MRLPSLISSLLFLCSASAYANAPVVFQRDVITIIPKPAAVEVFEGDGAPAEAEEAPLAPREPVDVNVEIRPQDALRLEWIHTLNTLPEDKGVMIVLEEAMPLPLMPLQVFTPVDVIVLDTQGLVSQLIPNVVLAGLSQEIVASRPTKAFLYMKAGTIEVYALEPNDRVEHPYFRPEQTVLQ